MEKTIDLKELFQIIKKRIWFITLITVLSGVIVGLASLFYLTPVYQASTQMLVNQTKSDQTAFSYNEVQTNIQLVSTYNLIIKSPAVLDVVANDISIGFTAKELQDKVKVESQNQSQIINLTVTDTNPLKAALIANKIVEVFKEKIVEFMKVDNVTVLSTADLDGDPIQVKPRPLIYTFTALALGLIVSVGITFLLEYLNSTIKDEHELEKLVGLPVLGVITSFDIEARGRRKRQKMKSKSRGEKFGISNA